MPAPPLRGAETYAFKDLEPEEQSLPAWYMYTAVGMLLLGLVWICLYYLIPGGVPSSLRADGTSSSAAASP